MHSPSRANRSLRLLAALVMASSAMAAAPSANMRTSPATAVPMAGEVTIVAPAGMSGIRLLVPDIGVPIRQDNELSTVDEPYTGDFALMQTAVPIGDGSTCAFDPQQFCGLHELIVVPDVQEPEEFPENNGLDRPYNGCITEDEDGARIPCEIRTDVYEVYIAADAPVTFTLRFPALAGSVTYDATGTIDGLLEAYPVTDCPTGDCDRFAIGSSVENFGTPERNGQVVGYAYARASYERIAPGVRSATAATIGAEACLYPSYFVPGGSTDPDDHPLGCEFTPIISEDGDPQWDANSSTTYLPTKAQSVGVIQTWPFLDGEDAYFGFNVRNEYAVPMYEGAHGAWVVWLEQGIY
jgi:hypothetical protein